MSQNKKITLSIPELVNNKVIMYFRSRIYLADSDSEFGITFNLWGSDDTYYSMATVNSRKHFNYLFNSREWTHLIDDGICKFVGFRSSLPNEKVPYSYEGIPFDTVLEDVTFLKWTGDKYESI